MITAILIMYTLLAVSFTILSRMVYNRIEVIEDRIGEIEKVFKRENEKVRYLKESDFHSPFHYMVEGNIQSINDSLVKGFRDGHSEHHYDALKHGLTKPDDSDPYGIRKAYFEDVRKRHREVERLQEARSPYWSEIVPDVLKAGRGQYSPPPEFTCNNKEEPKT